MVEHYLSSLQKTSTLEQEKKKNNPDTGVKPVVITYGSPKTFVGEESIEYFRSCCSEIIEVAQKNDMVTYMPPFARYKHPSKELKRVGDKFNIKKWFNPKKYHTEYDNYALYDESMLERNV